MEGGSTTNGTSTTQVDQPLTSKVALAIKSQDGDIVYYRVAPETKILDLLKTYCKGKNFNFREMNFVYHGNRIQSSKTVTELGIQDGDEIDALMPAGGGGNLKMFP